MKSDTEVESVAAPKLKRKLKEAKPVVIDRQVKRSKVDLPKRKEATIESLITVPEPLRILNKAELDLSDQLFAEWSQVVRRKALMLFMQSKVERSSRLMSNSVGCQLGHR